MLLAHLIIALNCAQRSNPARPTSLHTQEDQIRVRISLAVIAKIFPTKSQLAAAAAAQAATTVRHSIRERGFARIIAATGASQFEFLEALTQAPQIDWQRVELFHLDEYLGIPITHPASFRKYLLDRLINKVGIIRHHLLNGEQDPAQTIAQVTRELRKSPIDVAFVGIGENGHLAFNDPPADFQTDKALALVTLDAACRRQQVGEGHFSSIDDVPAQAVTLTIPALLAPRHVLAVVPEARKAQAVKSALEGPLTPACPASILRTASHVTLYLDRDSAALLDHAG